METMLSDEVKSAITQAVRIMFLLCCYTALFKSDMGLIQFWN